MAYTIDRIDVWSGKIKDKPGGLAEKLAPLAEAGASFEFVLARRDKKGMGVVFVAPLKGPAQGRAAKAAGLTKGGGGVTALRVSGPDKRGLGAAITQALAEVNVSMRGVSATAIGRKSVCYVAFDNKEDAAKARRALAKALK